MFVMAMIVYLAVTWVLRKVIDMYVYLKSSSLDELGNLCHQRLIESPHKNTSLKILTYLNGWTNFKAIWNIIEI